MSETGRSVMATPILAGAQRQKKGAISRAMRPDGTGDWLLVATLSGQGFVRCSGDLRVLERGDLLMFKPGAPQDYGHRDDDSRWRNVWIHFRPREDWFGWLNWPEVAPGTMVLKAAASMDLLAPLLNRVATADGTTLGRQRAMNALEQVILEVARDADVQHPATDPRIRAVLDHVSANLTGRCDVETLAGVAGLSRSRLTTLFRQQVGRSPQDHVESLRLLRAARLLQGGGTRVAAAAEASGFANPYYFATRFRKTFGATPSQYRAACRRTAHDDEREA